jgi:hypothetical protein
MTLTRLILVVTLLCPASLLAEVKHGKVITEKIVSKVLHDNLVGLNETRQVMIYLPPGYEASGKRYPVVYYFHNIFGNASSIMKDAPAVQLFEKAFAAGMSKELIFVVADYSTSGVGSLYENSSVSGRWLDFTAQELVPFMDAKFRTLRSSSSRAAVGDYMGGRAALKLGMTHADLFGIIYALHPVATGMGYLPWAELDIDWKKIMALKTKSDIDGLKPDIRTQIFITVSQAFLPNPSRPPLYCDFFMDIQNGELRVNPENMAKAKKGFMLEDNVVESVPNLRKLRALAFDWASYDGNYDHVFAARNLSRDLTDAGIDHEAEEYRGNPWSKLWKDNGRFYTHLIPFVARNLQFE